MNYQPNTQRRTQSAWAQQSDKQLPTAMRSTARNISNEIVEARVLPDQLDQWPDKTTHAGTDYFLK